MTTLTLHIEDDSQPIQGTIVAGEQRLEFTGWLGLAAALEQLLARSPAS